MIHGSVSQTSVTWSQGGNNYAKEYAYHWSGRPTSITYKTNGGTTATETMTWDKESRMLTNSLANASYVYNGFDTRVSKTVSSTTTTFKRAGADPVSPVVSDVVGGSTTTNYLPGISSRTGGTSTFSHSGIKNGILQTNSSQTNTATKRHDAFGDNPSTTGTWQTRFDYGGGFGYQRDDESGYKLLGHRYYDPEIGRFLTRDPIKDGRNWYTYCANDPVSRVDPTGNQFLSLVQIKAQQDESLRVGQEIGSRAFWISENSILPSFDPIAQSLKKLVYESYMEKWNVPWNNGTTTRNTDCGTFVSTSVGPYDPSFPGAGTTLISDHLKKSGLWKLIRHDVPLRPGDVTIVTGPERDSRYGHTAVVGTDGKLHEASLGGHGPQVRDGRRLRRTYRPTPHGIW